MYLAALVEASVAFFIYSRLTPIRGGVEKERTIRALMLQEGTCKALLVPFAIGDVGAVIAVAVHALGWEATEDVREWNARCVECGWAERVTRTLPVGMVRRVRKMVLCQFGREVLNQEAERPLK
jgi:hypothetical protein